MVDELKPEAALGAIKVAVLRELARIPPGMDATEQI
jgi:hypothetical protein